MRLLNMMNIVEAHGLFVHRRHPTQGRGRDRAAVVSVLAADDQLFVRLSQQVEVTMNKLDLRVVGFRTRIGKENVLKTVWCDLRKSRCQFNSRLIGALEEVVVEGQLGQLISDRLFDALLAIPEIATPQT